MRLWFWGYNLSNPALKTEPKERVTILDVTYEKKNMLLQSPCYSCFLPNCSDIQYKARQFLDYDPVINYYKPFTTTYTHILVILGQTTKKNQLKAINQRNEANFWLEIRGYALS